MAVDIPFGLTKTTGMLRAYHRGALVPLPAGAMVFTSSPDISAVLTDAGAVTVTKQPGANGLYSVFAVAGALEATLQVNVQSGSNMAFRITDSGDRRVTDAGDARTVG